LLKIKHKLLYIIQFALKQNYNHLNGKGSTSKVHDICEAEWLIDV